MILIEEMLGFFLTANDETRKNVNTLIKEAISSTIKLEDDHLVIELLEFLQTDKCPKFLPSSHSEVMNYQFPSDIIGKW